MPLEIALLLPDFEPLKKRSMMPRQWGQPPLALLRRLRVQMLLMALLLHLVGWYPLGPPHWAWLQQVVALQREL